MNVVSCQHIQKESFEALINHQWFIAWYGCCPMKDQFQMHSMYEGTLLQAGLLSLSCSRDKLCVVEVVVVHFVQLYFVNAQQKNKHPMPLNPFELAVVPLFHSSAVLRRYWIKGLILLCWIENLSFINQKLFLDNFVNDHVFVDNFWLKQVASV